MECANQVSFDGINATVNLIIVPYKSINPNYRIPKITLKTQITIVAFFPLMTVFYIESEKKVMALCSENTCNIYHVYISHM